MDRELAAKRRELRVTYLIEVYRKLEAAANRVSLTDELRHQVEGAAADVQLLGTPRQVKLVQQFAIQLSAQGGASLDDLLLDFRRELRDQVALEKVPDELKHLRFSRDQQHVPAQ